MKKLLIILLLASLTLSFTGCVGVWAYEIGNREFDNTNVEKIEIYSVNEGLALKYSVPESDRSIDHLDELYTPVSTVPKEQHGDFINELNQISFKFLKVTPMNTSFPKDNTYSGYVIKISYTDGAYDVISKKAQLYYTGEEAKEYQNFCNNLIWNSFVSSYVE